MMKTSNIFQIYMLFLFISIIKIDPVSAESQLTISNLSASSPNIGIFDPSITADEKGVLWMSYSNVVADAQYGYKARSVNTRIAFSKDYGSTWVDRGIINNAYVQPLPWPYNKLYAKWHFEVSRILFDPWAPKSSRWKIIYHRYLSAYDGKSPDSARLFEHGWMELKTAQKPTGPWSTPRKLFVGSGYNNDNNNNIGEPEIRLNKLNPTLKKCAAFSEPGLLATREGIYISLGCYTGKDGGEISLLKCDHNFSNCSYQGALLKDSDAPMLGENIHAFSGSDLIKKESQVFLVVTPVRQPGDIYQGCVLFKVTSLDAAEIDKNPSLYIPEARDRFSGACGYAGEKSTTGIFISKLIPTSNQLFQIFKTGQHP